MEFLYRPRKSPSGKGVSASTSTARSSGRRTVAIAVLRFVDPVVGILHGMGEDRKLVRVAKRHRLQQQLIRTPSLLMAEVDKWVCEGTSEVPHSSLRRRVSGTDEAESGIIQETRPRVGCRFCCTLLILLYATLMETSHEIDVTSLYEEHRRALEDVIGTELRRNQRLLISVTEVDLTPEAAAPRRAQSIGDWTSVYEGVSDEDIEAIDREVKTRTGLSRHLP